MGRLREQPAGGGPPATAGHPRPLARQEPLNRTKANADGDPAGQEIERFSENGWSLQQRARQGGNLEAHLKE
jgi:hypothetical protein